MQLYEIINEIWDDNTYLQHGMEMQLPYIPNDRYVKMIEEVIEEGIKDYNGRNGKMINKKVATEIANILTERFGIKILAANKPDSPAAIFTELFILSPYLEKYKKDIFAMYDMEALLNEIKKELKPLLDAKIEIDLEKVYIKNLPKKYKAILHFQLDIFIDPKLGYIKEPLTARELTAIVLHEVGHVFYTFMRSLVIIKDLFGLLDTTYEIITDNKERYKKIKVDGDSKNTINNKIAHITTNINTLMEMYKYDIMYNEREAFHTDMESEKDADSFATAFGYGKDLSTGLSKIFENAINRITFMNTVGMLFLTMFVLIFMFGLISFILNHGINITAIINFASNNLTMYLLTALLSTIAIIIFNIINLLTIEESAYSYEKPIERLEHIKSILISYIRKNNVSREHLKQIITEIEVIDKQIKRLKDLAYPVVTYLFHGGYFRPGAYFDPSVAISSILDKLNNNDFYYIAAKLKYSTNDK